MPRRSGGAALGVAGNCEEALCHRPHGSGVVGSATWQTNTSTATTATRTFDAFGGLVVSTGTPIGPFGFVGALGYQSDLDSGLQLLGHRYYDSSTGRFLSRDAVKDGRNWYAYGESSPTRYTDANGFETFAGKTNGYPSISWLAPGNWGSHNGLSKKTVKHIIMETNDDAIGIWGHGSSGKIYVNPTEYLDAGDLDDVAKWRDSHHKPKFNYSMVNECDLVSDPNVINNMLKMSNNVEGYKGTCVGASPLRDNWDKPVPAKSVILA